MLKKTFGGGPDIQFFLTNEEKAFEELEISREENFLYQNPYMFGYPDKNPKYYEVDLELKEMVDGKIKFLTIPYVLLLSEAMTAKSLLYYWATKLKVDVYKLSLEIIPADAEPTEMTAESDGMNLHEMACFFIKFKLRVKFAGLVGKLSKPITVPMKFTVRELFNS